MFFFVNRRLLRREGKAMPRLQRPGLPGYDPPVKDEMTA
jgi:hypothetical protein